MEDILEAIQKINRYTAGLEKKDFRQDEKTIYAVERARIILLASEGKQNQKIAPAPTYSASTRRGRSQRVRR